MNLLMFTSIQACASALAPGHVTTTSILRSLISPLLCLPALPLSSQPDGLAVALELSSPHFVSMPCSAEAVAPMLQSSARKLKLPCVAAAVALVPEMA